MMYEIKENQHVVRGGICVLCSLKIGRFSPSSPSHPPTHTHTHSPIQRVTFIYYYYFYAAGMNPRFAYIIHTHTHIHMQVASFLSRCITRVILSQLTISSRAANKYLTARTRVCALQNSPHSLVFQPPFKIHPRRPETRRRDFMYTSYICCYVYTYCYTP